MVAAAAARGGGEDGNRESNVLEQMMEAVEVVLQSIGEDVRREGLRKTPLRVASAFQGALAGYQLSAQEIIGPALFTEVGAGGGTGCGGGSGGIVVVSNIDSFALCESCFLPFRLRCHVVYVPCGQRVVGLSKFPRVAEIFAKRLQNPQKFADELVEALNLSFAPLGIGVVVETWHLQWPSCHEIHRKAKDVYTEERLGFGWVPVTVCAGKGQFENFHSSLWEEFFIILQLEGVYLEKSSLDGNGSIGRQDMERKSSCPFLVYDEQGVPSSLGSYYSTSPEVSYNGANGHNSLLNGGVVAPAAAMALGVESLLRAVGVVDSASKEDLRCTAERFIKWIVAATQGSRMSSYNLSLQQHGQDSHVLSNGSNGSSSNGHGFLSNGSNGSWSNGGSGPELDHRGLMNCSSSNGFSAIHTNGTGHRSNGILSYGNGHLTDGSLSNHYHVGSGSTLSGVQRNSNGLVKYGNGTTINNGKCTMSNGSPVSKMEVLSPVDMLSEGHLCLELDISFASLCEHHLLPFLGVVHVGYIRAKGSRPIDRSLVLKIVAMYSRRLQVQERLTRQIVEGVVSLPGLQGAMVVAEASHMCIMSRGVEKAASTTATVATIGKFSTDGAMRAAFLKRLPRKGAKKLLGQ